MNGPPAASTRDIGSDLTVLVVTFLIVLSLTSFIALASAIGGHETHEFDEWVIVALRNAENLADPLGPEWLEETIRDVSALGGTITLLLVTVLVGGYLALRRAFHALGLLAVSVIGGMIISSFLKDLFDRPRPELVPHLSYVVSPAFPSGHALMSAVTYLTLGALLARFVHDLRLKLYFLSIALLLTFLIGASRVYLGVHYPSDVLAGWLAGLAWALSCWLIAKALQERDKVEQSTEE